VCKCRARRTRAFGVGTAVCASTGRGENSRHISTFRVEAVRGPRRQRPRAECGQGSCSVAPVTHCKFSGHTALAALAHWHSCCTAAPPRRRWQQRVVSSGQRWTICACQRRQCSIVTGDKKQWSKARKTAAAAEWTLCRPCCQRRWSRRLCSTDPPTNTGWRPFLIRCRRRRRQHQQRSCAISVTSPVHFYRPTTCDRLAANRCGSVRQQHARPPLNFSRSFVLMRHWSLSGC